MPYYEIGSFQSTGASARELMHLVGRSSVDSVTTVPLGRGGHPSDCTAVVVPPCCAALTLTTATSTGTVRRVRLAESFIENSPLSKNVVAVVVQLMLSTNQRPSMSLVVIVCEN